MSTATESLPPGAGPDAEDLRQADLPPVHQIAVGTLVLTVVGGILMAAQYGQSSSTTIPIVLASAAGVLLLANIALLSRIAEFAWTVFFRVFGWALLAYLVIAGVLEFVFVFDHTPGDRLGILTSLLFLFAVNVPLMLAYSVARWQPVAD